MKLGVIDIGSNSIKLLVAETSGGTEFRRLSAAKEPVRLGRETLRTGHLSESAIKRAADTIKRFSVTANEAGVESLIAIATAAVREADNASVFIETIREQTGVEVEVLSGLEEARLIGLAAWQGCGMRAGQLVNIDIGGGSTEVTFVRDGEPSRLFSVKVGAVRLTDNFLSGDPPKRGELKRLRDEVNAAFESPAREMAGSRWDAASGTSGTILAIGEALRSVEVDDEAARAQRARDKDNASSSNANFNSAIITIEALARFNKQTARLPLAGRRAIAGISAQRAEIIIAGGAILEAAMHAFDMNELRTIDWALREGVVVDRLLELEAERLPPVPDSVDPRLRSVHAVGARFNYEEAHARHVAFLAERIFDQLGALHNLSRQHRTLLAAAALLHDVGYAIAHESHHKHSQYIIQHAELTGFSETERFIIALAARYHRRALPKERHADFVSLKPATREIVWKLGGILRLAEALDRNHDARVRDLRCQVGANGMRVVSLELECETNCEREARAVEVSSEMFAQAFDCLVVARPIAQSLSAQSV